MANLTNLLPAERQRAHARIYLLRLGTITMLFFAGLGVAAGVLLLPTYVHLSNQVEVKAAALESLSAGITTAEEEQLTRELALLAQNAQLLTKYGEEARAVDYVRAALAVGRPGVVLRGVRYATQGPTLTLRGVATTREALREYQRALQQEQFIESAELPVSTYAKESDLPFTITLTLTALSP